MKVVVDGYIYKYQLHGGVTRIYDEILPRMCRIDDTVSFEILTSVNPRHRLPSDRHIRSHIIPYYSFRLWPRDIWRHVEPPINYAVYRFTIKTNYGTGKGAIWQATLYRIPKEWDGAIVVTVHDMTYERFPDLFTSARCTWLKKQKQQCVNRADAVICVSETTRNDVLYFNKTDPKKIFVVPSAHSDDFKKIDFTNSNFKPIIDGPFLLHLGNRSKNKNFGLLLKTFSTWPKRKSIPLLVVGKEWSIDERRFLNELDIENEVIRIDYVDDRYLCCLYNTASAFIYPSLYEGFGIPVLEAMACGCPVVASRIPSTEEVAKQYPIYFEPMSVEGLQNALDTAIGGGRDSKRTGDGLEWVKRYSWHKTAEQTLRIYHKVER